MESRSTGIKHSHTTVVSINDPIAKRMETHGRLCLNVKKKQDKVSERIGTLEVHVDGNLVDEMRNQ